MMSDTRLVTCSPACTSGLREDAKHGAIYGPFGIEDEAGNLRLVNRLEFAGHSDRCIYCGGDLPRGRARRILAEVERRRSNRQEG